MERLTRLRCRASYSTWRVRPVRIAAVTFCTLMLYVLLAPSAPATSAVHAAPAGQATPNAVEAAFQAASQRWGVPVVILKAIGYVESHWEQRPGQPSIDNGYGIMHLTGRPDGTLDRAASLAGIPADLVRTDAASNISAGAALLSDISLKLNKTLDRQDLTSWIGAVQDYSGSREQVVKEGYAREVYRLINAGRSATLENGETVVLEATKVDFPSQPVTAPDSEDYGPALWVPASSSNYQVGRQYGPLSFIVIHDTEGSYSSAISWFQNPSSGVSAHYVIRSSDGQITQMVREANTAYHAGVWDYNVRALGIEHEGYESQPGWYTEAMYQSSAALTRNMADRYGIAKDRAHIIGHYQVPNQSHTDPGPLWNWTHYMSLVRRDSAAAGLVDNGDSGFSPVPTPVDPAHYWYTYSGGYNGSNTLATTSVSNQSSSVNSATWSTFLPTAGYYDLYAYIPWVDNNTTDTQNARYKVYASTGMVISHVSQKAITDVGTSSWAHIGRFQFGSGTAQVSLDDYTGETGRNVWFDALMWIPTTGGGGGGPTPTAAPPTRTPTPGPPTRTRTPVPTQPPTWTPTPAVTWTPGPCGMRFTDLPDDNWAYPFVAYLYCNGIISGYSDGTFRPGESTTRAQIAKMVVVGFGWNLYTPYFPDFSDVPVDSPYYSFVETAFIRGVLSGYSDGTFRPGSPVTRAQVTKMLVLAANWEQQFPSYPDFLDVGPGDWSYSFVETAFLHGIVSGYSDGTFRPGYAVNRAQFSKLLTLELQSPRTTPAVPGDVPKVTPTPTAKR